MRHFPKASLTAFVLTAAALSAATVDYQITPDADLKRVTVEVTIPATGPETQIQLPRWEPGWYRLSGNGETIQNISARDASGATIPVARKDGFTWSAQSTAGKPITFRYSAPIDNDNGAGFIAGPYVYMYGVGRTQEDCRVNFNLPADYKLALGLEGSGRQFVAPTYDVLIDNPVAFGNLVIRNYTSHGKTHTVAIRGAMRDQADANAIVKACQEISDTQGDFMKGLPYQRYVWQLNIAGGGGGMGLEHLSSTAITAGPSMNPGMMGLYAHEFFHLWNVKRIRPLPLGPFDYTKLPRTGNLWYSEGATEYFAQTLLGRYLAVPTSVLYGEVASNIQQYQGNPQHLKVSPYESSDRVNETANGRGNSDGYGISYYVAGFMAALNLDLELIRRTKGKRSLDDVNWALWQQCKDNKPGFKEDDIRRHCIAVGGPEMGAFYDRVVMKPGEMNTTELLHAFGLEMQPVKQTRTDLGFGVRPNNDGTGMIITTIRDESIKSVLPADAVIQSVNGAKVTGATGREKFQSWFESVMPVLQAEPGKELTLTITTADNATPHDVKVKSVGVEFTRMSLAEVAGASADQIRLRNIWLAKKRG